MMARRRYALMDLFAGCGGMTRGFHDTGRFESVLALDSDSDAAATYALNFPATNLHICPIEEVEEFPQADVVIGGPPCQGFSPLNRNLVGYERRGLWRHYLRALGACRASAFVMENVPELLSTNEYLEFKRQAEHLGYTVDARVLNAANFGVAQRRWRAIVIGISEGEVPWPNESHGDPDELPLGTKPWVTFRDAVAGLPHQPDGKDWHRDRHPRPDSIRRYKAVPPDGGDRFQMQRNLEGRGLAHLVPPCWRNKPSGTTDVFGRLWWDRPSVTIRTEFYKPEKGRYLHPSAHRAITVREAARLMSFPDDFLLPLDQAMTSVARQIGNAVPPLLARALATRLADALDALTASNPVHAAAAA
jgi:DNA (cytosine-5)-methyltransferase 1